MSPIRANMLLFFFFMPRRPPRSTRTDTLFPYTTLFLSCQFDVLALHVVASALDPHAGGDHHLRAQAQAEVVRVRRWDLVEDLHRRAFQVHHHLGGGDLQALAGAEVARPAGPAPSVPVKAARGAGFPLPNPLPPCLAPVAPKPAPPRVSP